MDVAPSERRVFLTSGSGLVAMIRERAERPRFLAPREFGVLLTVLLTGVLVFALAAPALRGKPLIYPFLGVAYFYAISLAISAQWSPLYLAIGADGLLSVSKCQFLLWNATVVFSYLWIFSTKAAQGQGLAALGVPHNVLFAMGFSITTAAAAKGITSAYLGIGRISKPPQAYGTAGARDLVATDDGQTPDLSKIQMLIWTAIAITVYLVKTAVSVNSSSSVLPDIDEALLVLMGLGQAAYLGNKLTGSDVPILTSLNRSAGQIGSIVTISGTNLFGNVTVLIDGKPSDDGKVFVVAPNASSFDMTIPQTIDLRPVMAPQLVQIAIVVDGVRSANSLPFTVSP